MTNLADSYLSGIYDTPTALRKIASAQQLANTLPAEEQEQWASLSPEQMESIAQELMSDDGSDAEKTAGYDDEMLKEAAANFEMADYMGRIMAHSMFNEIANIKEAGAVGDFGRKVVGGFKQHGGKAVAKGKELGGKAVGAVRSAGKSYAHNMAGGDSFMGRRAGNSLSAIRGSGAGKGMGPHTAEDSLKASLTSSGRKSLATRAGTAIGLGGAGYGAHQLAKEASAFDNYTHQYAMNLLQESGIDPSAFIEHVNGQNAAPQQGYSQMNQGYQNGGRSFQGQVAQPQAQMNSMQGVEAPIDNSVKMANDSMAQFQQAVHERALAMLSEAGYPVAEDDYQGANQDMSGMASGAPAIQ